MIQPFQTYLKTLVLVLCTSFVFAQDSLFDYDFWASATAQDVRKLSAQGTDWNARATDSSTIFMWAVS
jgi:hypothetical protein